MIRRLASRNFGLLNLALQEWVEFGVCHGSLFLASWEPSEVFKIAE